MYYLKRLAQISASTLFWLAGFVVLAMMLHVTLDILSRYILNAPLFGTLEIVASYYMVACAYLPLAYVQYERSQMVIELFTQNLSGKKLLSVELFANLIGAVFLTLMAWKTTEVALKKMNVGEVVEVTMYQLPVWPSRWVIAVATIVAAFVIILQVVEDSKRLVKKTDIERYPDSKNLL